MTLRIALVVGTRPEAIKMAPLYLAMRDDARFEPLLIATAQHRRMLDQVLSLFEMRPDVDLDVMRPGQSIGDLTSRLLTEVQGTLAHTRPDAVLVHGDTTTCFASAMAAFYERLPIGHVEAGLRTHDLNAPWPEEMNRRLVDAISTWCFAPTSRAAANLQAERIPKHRTYVTGNTAIDALRLATEVLRTRTPSIVGLRLDELKGMKVVLVTGHRRESFGKPLRALCRAFREIVQQRRDVALVYPVHLNPNVSEPVKEILGNQERIFLIEPQEYLSFIALMKRCDLIITDSGGVQEEAPSLGKPVLVTRKATERPEAVELGFTKIVGTNPDRVVTEALLALDRGVWLDWYINNPYGDGHASRRILDALAEAEELTSAVSGVAI